MKIHTFFNLQKIGGSLGNATPQTVNLKSFAARTPQYEQNPERECLSRFDNLYLIISLRTVAALRKQSGGLFLVCDRSGFAARTPQYEQNPERVYLSRFDNDDKFLSL